MLCTGFEFVVFFFFFKQKTAYEMRISDWSSDVCSSDLVQVDEVEAPAELLAATVLAHEPIKPALQATGQVEIGAVDGQHERVVEDGGVEPVGHDQLEAERPAAMVGLLLPFVDPGKAMHPTFRGLADRGRDGGGLQPVERGLEAVVVA